MIAALKTAAVLADNRGVPLRSGPPIRASSGTGPGPGLPTVNEMSPSRIALSHHRLAGPAAGGFTLVEMMVSLSLLVLVTLALLPSMSEFNARNRMTGIEGELMASVGLARSEAARRGVPVLLVAATGGVTGNVYAGGWRLVLDQNSNGAADSGEATLRLREAIPTDLKLDGSSPVAFGPTGYLTPATAVTFTLCRLAGRNRGASLTITPSGLTDAAAITTCS